MEQLSKELQESLKLRDYRSTIKHHSRTESLDSQYQFLAKELDNNLELEDDFFIQEIEIQPRTINDIRNRFISKLAHQRMFKPIATNKGHQTIVIFDWDDTLLCTSAFRPGSQDDMTSIKKEYSSILTRIDELVVRYR